MQDWTEPYATWQAEQTPQALHQVVTSVEPVIRSSLARMSASNDGAMQAKARLLVAEAVRTYKPDTSTALPTWVHHQMAQLHRFRRLSNQTLQVPERLQLDALKLENTRRELQDKLQREPDMSELGDAAQMAPRRMRDIRLAMRTMPGSSALAEDANVGTQTSPAHVQEAMDAVYDEADRVDRLIMQGRMGMNGQDPIPPLELMRQTKLSPFQLSRRATALSQRIHRLTSDLEGIY